MVDENICLTIAHNIFLTTKQRHDIAYWADIEVHTTGVAVPVWCKGNVFDPDSDIETSEPAEEIFCRYIISSNSGTPVVEEIEEGYKIRIATPRSRKKLLDFKDKGSGMLNFTHRTETMVRGNPVKTLHCVAIKDESYLYDTLTD